MKKCTKCKIEKDESLFGSLKSSKDGLRSHCKDCRVAESYNRRLEKIDYNKEYFKAYYLSNKTKLKNYHKEWRDKVNYSDKRKDSGYYRTEKYKESNRKYKLLKNNSDPLYKLKGVVRCRIKMFFKSSGLKKITKTENMLGCNFEQAKLHIESLFKDGMNWSNHGEWHIDHIKPLSLAKTNEDVIKLCHYTNLQPLWAIDNLIKGKVY